MSLKQLTKMDSFHVYLPSNACYDLYPNNSASDYQTRLDQAIELEGQWEVGVESIVYTSHVDDKFRTARIHCDVSVPTEICVNDHNKVKYVTDEDGKWIGFRGIQPTTFEKDPTNKAGVFHTLNMMNRQMFRDNASGFQFGDGLFTKDPAVEDLIINLSPRLGKVVGKHYGRIEFQADDKKELKAEDYMLTYLSEDVLQLETTIEIKTANVVIDVTAMKKSFKKLFMEKSKEVKGIVFRFSRNNKLIVDVFNPNYALLFSPDLARLAGFYKPIIGRSTTWGYRAITDFTGHENASWYVKIFSTELKVIKTETVHHIFDVIVHPWQHETMAKAIQDINTEVQRAIRTKLQKQYDPQQHQFSLLQTSNGFSKLSVGKWLSLKLDKGLSHLLSLEQNVSPGSQIGSDHRIGSLENRERQLFLLSNIARTTAYGEHQLQILQSFLHEPKKGFMTQKHFKPIMFVPLLSNNIPRIHLQLTSESYEPINLGDGKTLVCLIFRKVREKSMM